MTHSFRGQIDPSLPPWWRCQGILGDTSTRLTPPTSWVRDDGAADLTGSASLGLKGQQVITKGDAQQGLLGGWWSLLGFIPFGGASVPGAHRTSCCSATLLLHDAPGGRCPPTVASPHIGSVASADPSAQPSLVFAGFVQNIWICAFPNRVARASLEYPGVLPPAVPLP